MTVEIALKTRSKTSEGMRRLITNTVWIIGLMLGGLV